MAKPMPTLPPVGEKIIEFMPITWPRRSKVGPPELPRLMGASIWMKLVYCWLPSMLRLSEETMPAVTELESPKGLPTATTQSPTRRRLSSPKSTFGSGRSLWIFNSATSVTGSLPTRVATNSRLSGKVTVIFLLASTTWLLVTT